MTSKKTYNKLLEEAQKLIKKNKFNKALPILEKAITLNPEKCDAYGILGDYYGLQGKYEEALKNHQIVIEKSPHNVLSLTSIGECLIQLGQIEEGVNNLKIVLNIDPKNYAAYNQIIFALIKEGRDFESYHYLLDALKFYPGDGKFNFLLANKIIYNREKLGIQLTSQVLRLLDIAENKGINYIVINKLRGDYYDEMQDWVNAAKHYSKCLVLKYDEEIALSYADCLNKLELYEELDEVVNAMADEGSKLAKQLIREFLNN